jgi:hypothetical protein
MSYICKLCNAEFPTITKLNKHLNRKYPCNKPPSSSLKPICEYCNRKYSCVSSYNRHLEYCKKYKLNKASATNSKNIATTNSNNTRTTNSNNTRTTNSNNTRTVNSNNIRTANSNNTNNNINLNININNDNKVHLLAFGKEDTSNITEGDIIKLLFKNTEEMGSAIVLIAKIIHCNPNMPQNHNIKVTNNYGQYAKFYNGKEFASISKKTLMEKVKYNMSILINKFMNKFNNVIPQRSKDAYNKSAIDLEKFAPRLNELFRNLSSLFWNFTHGIDSDIKSDDDNVEININDEIFNFITDHCDLDNSCLSDMSDYKNNKNDDNKRMNEFLDEDD